MSGVVIVGAGHAGSQFAVSLRAEGYLESITLIDPSGELPYHKPPLSKTFLKTPEDRASTPSIEQMYQSADVKRLAGTVTAINPSARTIVVDGASLAYDELVLATGARNRCCPNLPMRRMSTVCAIWAMPGAAGRSLSERSPSS